MAILASRLASRVASRLATRQLHDENKSTRQLDDKNESQFVDVSFLYCRVTSLILGPFLVVHAQMLRVLLVNFVRPFGKLRIPKICQVLKGFACCHRASLGLPWSRYVGEAFWRFALRNCPKREYKEHCFLGKLQGTAVFGLIWYQCQSSWRFLTQEAQFRRAMLYPVAVSLKGIQSLYFG